MPPPPPSWSLATAHRRLFMFISSAPVTGLGLNSAYIGCGGTLPKNVGSPRYLLHCGPVHRVPLKRQTPSDTSSFDARPSWDGAFCGSAQYSRAAEGPWRRRCGSPGGRHMVPPEPFGYTALVARESTEQQGCCLKEEYDWLVDFYVMCMIVVNAVSVCRRRPLIRARSSRAKRIILIKIAPKNLEQLWQENKFEIH